MFFRDPKAIRDLRELVADLRSDLKRLQDEWDDMAALLRRRAGNAARQVQRLEEAEQRVAAPPETEEAAPVLDPISQRILNRRRRIANHEVSQ